MSYADVGKDLKSSSEYYTKANPTKCIVVKNLTKSLIVSNTLSMLTTRKYGYWRDEDDKDGFVEKGIRIGTMLGRKLQVRGESRDTKWTRQDKGRLDKRLIAELGFGNERVFQTNFVESYSDAILHISVDASGSMGGDKWNNTMTSVVAICKAVSMIQNVDVVVSIRSTHNSSGSYRSRKSGEYPVILVAYDSRVDKFSKVKNLFSFIRCSGTTPEGLCYEAIMNEIIPASNDRESYFLNFSDGMPMFSNDDVDYYHDTALNHTKKMVEEIKNRGIKVLSYFIGDEYDRGERNMDAFKTMYGKDSQFIDVTSVMSISKTMNKKFLEK
jgi:nitric oxide reductase activation protein